MNREELIKRIRERKTFLCVGLDTDVSKIPQGVTPLEFNKAIIDATREHCVAYKPNLAFYEAMGIEGWELLQETMSYIGNEHFTIADAKRGDIGNTSTQYAKAFFEKLNFDSITVAPYMGRDSVEPFLQFKNKWAIVLALTSNVGAFDFQMEQGVSDRLYEKVLKEVSSWGSPENIMFVVGATKAEWLKDIRAIIPDHFLLVPGVGAQGGSLEEVVKYGMNNDVGLLINASRSIQYASNIPEDYAKAAKAEAERIHEQMKFFL
ncbi:MAG: orotidine-5'-phosphate decarboxylase [Bacteroidetes bacterium]|nr:orotidine-5'-phosphate decarboxylase [Bacteroidota bacterium]